LSENVCDEEFTGTEPKNIVVGSIIPF
jgi:hypothetical protein